MPNQICALLIILFSLKKVHLGKIILCKLWRSINKINKINQEVINQESILSNKSVLIKNIIKKVIKISK